MIMTVAERLMGLAKLYAEKSAIYGDDYKNVGHTFMAMFPKGLTLDSPEKFRQFYLFTYLLTKVNRYSQCLARGEGHADSLADLAVYAQMLAALDEETMLKGGRP